MVVHLDSRQASLGDCSRLPMCNACASLINWRTVSSVRPYSFDAMTMLLQCVVAVDMDGRDSPCLKN